MLIKLPKHLRGFVNTHIVCCPICGCEMLDGRYKEPRFRKISPITTRQSTHKSITKQCKSCGLRFNVTWKEFFKVLHALYVIETNIIAKRELLKNSMELKEFIGKHIRIHRISGEHKIPWA